MKQILRLAALFWLVTVGSAVAQSRLVVVELFTSQGCSSCPPADRMLTELAKRDDVLPLALHVDYWDYIGWADSFADPSFTKRQKAYARAAGSRSIYTPQFVIGGAEFVIGPKGMELSELIRTHASQPYPFEVQASRDGAGTLVRIAPTDGQSRDMVLQYVTFEPEQRVSIKHGENAGKTLVYSNVVTSVTELTRWDGQHQLEWRVKAPEGQPAAVILQKHKAGPIVGAAALR